MDLKGFRGGPEIRGHLLPAQVATPRFDPLFLLPAAGKVHFMEHRISQNPARMRILRRIVVEDFLGDHVFVVTKTSVTQNMLRFPILLLLWRLSVTNSITVASTVFAFVLYNISLPAAEKRHFTTNRLFVKNSVFDTLF